MSNKYYRVNHNCVKEIMSSSEVSFLQQSGSYVKVLRRARPEELEASAIKTNSQSAKNYLCHCGHWLSSIEYNSGKCPTCNKVIP
jgi:hypothetical protein